MHQKEENGRQENRSPRFIPQAQFGAVGGSGEHRLRLFTKECLKLEYFSIIIYFTTTFLSKQLRNWVGLRYL